MQICNVHLLDLMAITTDLFFFPQHTGTSGFSDDHFVHRIEQLYFKFVQRRLLFVFEKAEKVRAKLPQLHPLSQLIFFAILSVANTITMLIDAQKYTNTFSPALC
jgi:hypothetical protein